MKKLLSNIVTVVLAVVAILLVMKLFTTLSNVKILDDTIIINNGNGGVYSGTISVTGSGNVVYSDVVSTDGGVHFLGEVYSNGVKISGNSGNVELKPYYREVLIAVKDSMTAIINCGSVEIKQANDDVCKIIVEGKVENEPEVDAGPGYFELKCAGRVTNMKVDVYLPKAMCNKLKVKTISSDINYENGDVQTLCFETVSGDVCVKNEVPAEIDIETVSGDIYYQSSLNTYVDFDSVSGRCNAGRVIAAQVFLEASTVSGDLKVE